MEKDDAAKIEPTTKPLDVYGSPTRAWVDVYVVACAIISQVCPVARLATLSQGELPTSTEWARWLGAGSWEASRCERRREVGDQDQKEGDSLRMYCVSWGEQLRHLGLVRQAEDPLHDRDEVFRLRRERIRFGYAVVPAQGAQRVPHPVHRVPTHVTASAPGALEIWAHGSHVEAKELKLEREERV